MRLAPSVGGAVLLSVAFGATVASADSAKTPPSAPANTVPAVPAKPAPPPPANANPAATAKAPPSPPANTVSPAAARSRLGALFAFDVGPAVLRVAKDVALGTPGAEARRRAPALFLAQPYAPKGFDDIRINAALDGEGRVGSFVMELGCKSALRDTMDLWGEPTTGYEGSEKAKLYWWFFPRNGVRATLTTPDKGEGCSLTVDRYTPLAAVLGDGNGLFGFERESLLLMREADVVRVYGAFLSKGESKPCDTQILQMPPVEYDPVGSVIRLQCSADQVNAFDLIFYFRNRFSLKDDVQAGLARKYGQPSPRKNIMGRPTLEYRGRGRTVTFETDERLKKAIVHVGWREDESQAEAP